MFFETLRFSRICVLKSCVPGFNSWRGAKVNATLFFYTTHKQVLQIVPMLNQSYEIMVRTSLNHDCCTCVSPCMIYIYFFVGGGGKGVSPDSRSTAGIKGDLSTACRLPTPLWRSRKNRIVKKCNIYPTSQYVVVTYFSSLRPCIQSWLEIINELDFKSDASSFIKYVGLQKKYLYSRRSYF